MGEGGCTFGIYGIETITNAKNDKIYSYLNVRKHLIITVWVEKLEPNISAKSGIKHQISFFFYKASYLSWVTRCCSKGQRKAKRANDPTSCNSDDLDRRRFNNAMDRIICRHAERICCVKEIQKLSCESGKYEAS